MATAYYPIATVARVLNLSERRVQQLVTEGVLPRPEKGKYDLIACVRAYIKYLQDRAYGKDAAPQDTHMERARLLKAQADKTELEVAMLRGNLVPIERVETDWLAMVMAARSRMLSIPSKSAFQIAVLKEPQEIERFLKRAIYEALTELAQTDSIDESLSEDDADGDLGLDATAAIDGEPVGGSAPETESGSE